MSTQCQGITRSNQRCKRKIHGNSYCYMHLDQEPKNEDSPIEDLLIEENQSEENEDSLIEVNDIEENQSEENEDSLIEVNDIEEDEECIICCEERSKKDMKELSCKHSLCVNCLNNLNKMICPFCRTEIKDYKKVIDVSNDEDVNFNDIAQVIGRIGLLEMMVLYGVDDGLKIYQRLYNT